MRLTLATDVQGGEGLPARPPREEGRDGAPRPDQDARPSPALQQRAVGGGGPARRAAERSHIRERHHLLNPLVRGMRACLWYLFLCAQPLLPHKSITFFKRNKASKRPCGWADAYGRRGNDGGWPVGTRALLSGKVESQNTQGGMQRRGSASEL